MKTALMIIIAGVFVLPCSGQLNSAHNHLRAGDVLVKQQVEYTDPGLPGANRIWDFSRVKTINDEYTLVYDLPPMEGDSVYILGYDRFKVEDIRNHELIVGTEHNTMYYYRQSDGVLLQLGHENPVVKLRYTTPMTLMHLPLNYKEFVSSAYYSKGLYSSTSDIASKGLITTTADAYGKMVLPSGDTLSPVLRVKTIQTILDISKNDTDEQTNGIKDKGTQVETCRWYSKGYRYPVFETIRGVNLNDESDIFSTAFFFPPQDHLYLDTDPDNLALLEEIWDMEEKEDPSAKTVTLEDIMSCKIYPNPVESYMTLEYELKEDAKVSFELYSIEGLPVKRIKAQDRTKGTYTEVLDCTGLYPKNYVLRITANSLHHNQIIIKK